MLGYVMSQIYIAAYQTTLELNNQNNSHVIRLTRFVGKKFEKDTEGTTLPYSMMSGLENR